MLFSVIDPGPYSNGAAICVRERLPLSVSGPTVVRAADVYVTDRPFEGLPRMKQKCEGGSMYRRRLSWRLVQSNSRRGSGRTVSVVRRTAEHVRWVRTR
ncbi:hypothetical protein EVAR_64307_1 [Eumeta japonica]|uniref:Uncharacterized protein n=1 Tax=Eumeta variegata TaxID=151549 RepID=A0A4C2A9X9_EUMVA|nr:hypothetical protein EVAR_64307_1 [Eumeta japonica]